ncbi:MAG: response regulator [Bacteroidota bacterium]
MKRYAILLFLSLIHVSLSIDLFAQSNSDILAEQKALFEQKYKKAIAYSKMKSDSARYYVQQAQRFAYEELLECMPCLSQADYLDSYHAYYQNEMAKAVELGKKAFDKAEERQEWVWCVENLKLIAYAHKNQGHLAKASDAFFKALEICETKGTISIKGDIFKALAELYRFQDDLEKAMTYIQQAIELHLELDNKKGHKDALNELANIYADLDQKEEAFKTYHQILSPFFASHVSHYDSSKIYNNLGRLHRIAGDYDQAKFYLDRAISIKQYRKYAPSSLALSLNELMTLYKDQGQFQEAKVCANQLLPLVDSIDNIYHRRNIYYQYNQIQAGLGDYKGAYQTQAKYLQLQDSIHRKDERLIASDLESKYQLKTKEQEIALLHKDKQIARFQRNGLIGGLLLFGLLGLLGLHLWTQKKNREQAALIAQTTQWQALDQLKSTFFTNITHELRTPLTLILSPLDVLLKGQYGPLQETMKPVLKVIQRNGLQLKKMIDELLELSKMEANKLALEEESLNLKFTLSHLFSAFESAASIKQINYQFICSFSNDLWVVLDRKKLASILNNLISNALKFTPPKGSIFLQAKIVDQHIHIEINDNGRGIHPDDLPHVFDRFYQTTRTDAPQEGGTGIGLALAKAYTERMNGQLSVVSEWGSFTTFQVRLPLKEVEAENKTAQQFITKKLDLSLPEVSLAEQAPPLRALEAQLLLVEDHPDMQAYLRSILSPHFQIHIASDGQQALQYLHSHPLPDLIISDVMMPQMDGFELLRQVKSKDTYASIPVIMLTARAHEVDRLKALRIGVDDYMTKPFSSDELIIRIKNLLRNLDQRKQEKELAPSLSASSSAGTVLQRSTKKTLSQEWLKKVEGILLREITNKQYNLNHLADELNISISKLSRQIKAMTGLSPNKYFLEIRLYKAKRHLEARDFQTVAEVSYAIGFEDPHYFTKIYHKRFGKKPTSYLK